MHYNLLFEEFIFNMLKKKYIKRFPSFSLANVLNINTIVLTFPGSVLINIHEPGSPPLGLERYSARARDVTSVSGDVETQS